MPLRCNGAGMAARSPGRPLASAGSSGAELLIDSNGRVEGGASPLTGMRLSVLLALKLDP